MAGLDRSDRALRGRIGAYRLHATHDSRETSKPGRIAFRPRSSASSTRTGPCRRRSGLGERPTPDRPTSRSSHTCRRRHGGSARPAGEAIDERHGSRPAGPGGTGRVRLDGPARARPGPLAVARPGRRRDGGAGCPPVVRPSSDRPAPAQATGRVRPPVRLLGSQPTATERPLRLRPDQARPYPARAPGLAPRQAEAGRGRDRNRLAGHPPARDPRPVHGIRAGRRSEGRNRPRGLGPGARNGPLDRLGLSPAGCPRDHPQPAT
jgi:hypothetical protein